ncbi:MAG: hypothetical protein EOO69_04450 [Moraxellaceae bacterium]|nr:MAG: hypothetical protein EOO69_04450 [Moraxellaceae bacterium]
MSTSSVPTIQFTPNGVVLPQEAEIYEGVYQDYNAAFGGNLNPAGETPQGQLISSTTAIIGDHNALWAEFVNQIDPDIAAGFMQDAIGRIYFLNRHPATSTVVSCTCFGVPGTIIPEGALATDDQDNLYSCQASVTIASNGQVNANFACTTTGPIACPAGALARVYRAVMGWESITNLAAGVVGTLVESRADFEYRRKQSVAINGHGSLPSIYASVFDLDNVIDVYVTENTSSQPITVGVTNYQLAPHSLYVAVLGGNNSAIGKTIWLKKDVGCDYNGNTAINVTDDSYSYPQPTYSVKFQRPSIKPILFNVALAYNSALPANITELVQAAVIKAFNGIDGGARARIGGTIFASRYYAGITGIDSRVQIIEIQIGIDTPVHNSVTLGINQAPSISAANITVTMV